MQHPTAPQIRIANITDADQISTVLYEAFVEFRPLYTSEGFDLTTPSAERIRQRWTEGPVWVADADRHILGTISAVPMGDTLHLRSMAVLPESRGMGIAQQLLECAETYAKENGFGRIDLDTTPFLYDAIRLYTKNGFRRTKDHDLGGTPLFGMEKEVVA